MLTKIWLLSASYCNPVAFMHKPTLTDLLKYTRHYGINIGTDWSELDQEFLDKLTAVEHIRYISSCYKDIAMYLKQIDVAENTSPMGEL